MAQWKEIDPRELSGNVFSLISKDWALVTAQKEEAVNTMTISWGGMGWLWNVPVGFVFVRPQRYTYGFMEASDRFSISFYGEEERGNLTYCGTVSGRDADKIAHCGYTLAHRDGVPYFEEAKIVLLCKKIYFQDLEKGCALSDVVTKQYPEEDYHRMYIGQITAVLIKED